MRIKEARSFNGLNGVNGVNGPNGLNDLNGLRIEFGLQILFLIIFVCTYVCTFNNELLFFFQFEQYFIIIEHQYHSAMK